MAETRVALISGGNRGLGLETARQLARAGLLIAIGSREEAAGQRAVDSLAREGLDAAVVRLDVVDDASVAAAVGEVKRLFGRVDVLVNNAGILLDRGPDRQRMTAAETPVDLVRRSLEVNALGAMRLIQAVLPMMREVDYGRIVNVSSRLGQLTGMGAGSPGYRMSKAALNALTALTAAELGTGPIKVNCCHPGWVRTDMGGPDAERTVEEAADTIVWLATLPDDGPTGGFFMDRKPLDW